MIRNSIAVVSAVGLCCLGSSAFAQTAGPPVSSGEALVGPAVPGVCVLSRDAVLANAKVGQAANARLLELSKQVQAEIEAERAPIEAEVKALDAQKAALTPAQFEERGKPLAARWDALQRKAALRGREIEATRVKALGGIATQAQPVIAQVYASRKCGLLLTRDAMMGGNPAADLTAAVVQGLDARISTITFPREALPAETAAAPKAR
jgi:hypothetical protein